MAIGFPHFTWSYETLTADYSDSHAYIIISRATTKKIIPNDTIENIINYNEILKNIQVTHKKAHVL